MYLFVFFNWRMIAYNVVLVSAIPQHESVIIMYIYLLPFESPSHPSGSSQSAGRGSLCYTAASHLFTCGGVCMSMPFAQFVPPVPCSAVSTSLWSTSVSPVLPCTQVHHYHFCRFHIYEFIQDIYFSLSDLLHCV